MGVAVVGSVFSSLFGPHVRAALSPYLARGLSRHDLNLAASSTHAAQLVVAHCPASLRPAVTTQVTTAVMDGLHRGCLVAGGVSFVAAVIVLTRLPKGEPAGAVALVHA